jgi:RNA polymerase sigma-70 factor (ECF subfamily)
MQAGQSNALENRDLEEVTRACFARIHRAALVLTGNPWDADDLAQETFLVLAGQWRRFQGKSSVYTWLYGILLNLDRRERRRHGMRRRKLKVLWDNEPARDRVAPQSDLPVEVAEWKKSLWSFVARLPDGQREALVLRFSEGLRYDEIAQVMGCPLGTVKSRIFHGLAAVRRLLDADAESGGDSHQPPTPRYGDLTDAV